MSNLCLEVVVGNQRVDSMELRERFIKEKPRENSGTSSSNRFDYQQDWAICKLLELHKTGNDYLLVLDYHDDVVVLDSENQPKQVSFYQLKTKDKGNWTMTDLLRRKKGKEGLLPSMLGKLFGCKLTFGSNTLSINFVSNATFSVELKNKDDKSVDKRTICFAELSSKVIADVIKKIRDEHYLTEDPEFTDITFLHVSDLILNNRETYVKGKLSDFLEELNPNGKFKISLVYTTIFDEIKRKNNYEYSINDFEELLKHKSISKKYFQTILKNFNVDNSCEEMWTYTQNKLSNEAVPLSILPKLRDAWRKYEIDRMDGTNLYLKALREAAANIVVPYKLNLTITSLYQGIIEPAYKEFIEARVQTMDLYDEFYIKVIILMEYYGI
ncbi:DUF4297 domain-containing protein [Paenibacillus sp. J22TS3]|uniref:DUF4297 domain-containing protein n=1 Tax=Paenibacillus sp. J22TS3 TaxID=2807192 RepID=UPI001B0488BF|nr:DUF4297 domain-containing protein [Paenibacillus sp. J22TS3]GIP20659.1 hypothetical protein J22TS3_09340 [Paenibacillus sp. J22TS3]